MSNSSFNSNDVGSENLFGNGLLSCGNPDFILPKELSLDDLHEIQRRLLRIALQVTTILERHGFKYSIAFGTLLGAVRHQGFIPWDDDFDFLINIEWGKKSGEEGLFIGDVGLWGCGIGTRARLELHRIAAEEYGIREILSRIRIDNVGSYKSALRAGFVERKRDSEWITLGKMIYDK